MSERAVLFVKLALFIALTVLIAAALYFAFFRTPPRVQESVADDDGDTSNLVGADDAEDDADAEGDSDAESEGGGTLPVSQVADGGATATLLLTNTRVVSPTATSNGALAYYDPADGHFYTIDDSGEVELFSQASFPEADTVTFASDASAVVLEFPDGSNVVYNFESGRQTTLPSHWEDFSFNGSGDEIASKSIGNDPSNRSLVITTTDGTNTRVVAALGNNDDKVDVNVSPSGNVVAFSATGSAQSFDRNEYYLIDDTGDVAGSLLVQGSNFSAIWSPGGTNILYSVSDASNNYRPALWYADSRGDRRGDVRLHLSVETWVEKCVFADASTLYCAVPQEVVDGSGDNHSMIDAPDSLYRIDLPSGDIALLGYAAAETQMFNLTLSDDGDMLYFQDAAGRLASMQLR